MTQRTTETLVGLFVLLGIAALFLLALQAANLGSFSTEPSYTLNARFDNIGGLKVRAPVKSAGVVVGRISEIRFLTDVYEAEVVMSIDARYPFPRDTSAKILTSGLLGDQYIGLTAGGDSAHLKSGDTLKLTQSAIVLENLIGQFLYSKAAEGPDNADKK